ncbi:MAG: LuxR C-terminal-related transcriptional regulator [Acidimicrobiales bacterium]
MAPEGCSRRDRPLVGRERELAWLIAAVTEPDGRGAIVAGEAGVGKSHLIERATAFLLEQGWIALRTRGDPTRVSPFGSLGSLLAPPDVDPHRWAGVLRRGLDHLVDTAAPRRPLLVADDLHAFDAASATLVQHAVLARRVRLIGSYRTGDDVPDAVTALWKDDVVERVDLSPLAREDCDELVERLMDGPVAAQARARLWRWTEGNPLLVTEVVVHSRSRGAWSRSAGLWHLDAKGSQPRQPVLSPTLAAILRDRMAGAPPGVVDVVDALALAGHLPLGVLEHLVGRRMLALAERSRLTRTRHEASRRVLTLEHPLYGDLRRAGLGDERIAEVRGRVLEVFERFDEIEPGDVPLLARWYVETGRTGPRAADLLTRGAELAWAANDSHTAAELARRARELQHDDRSTRVLVSALARLGEAGDLHQLVDEVICSAADDDVRAEAVRGHASVLFHLANRPDDAEALLCDAASASTDARCRSALLKEAALLRLQRGDLGGAEALVQPPSDSPDPVAAGDAAAVLAPIRLLQGRVSEALSLAGHGRPSHPMGPDDLLADPVTLSEHAVLLIGAWVETDRLRQADEAVQRAILALDADAGPFSTALVAFQMGRIARLRGRPRAAARWFRESAAGFESIRREGFVAWALAGLVEVQAQIGDRLGAEDTAAECREHRYHPIGLGAGEVARSLAWALVANLQLDEAADRMLDAARRSLLAGEVLHAAHAFHDLVRIGRSERGVERLDDLTRRSDGLLVSAFAHHARATVAGDVVGLERSARRFATLGCDLHAAEAWTQVAQICQVVGRERRSAAAHREALVCRRSCEGARTPLLAVATDMAALSRREREIARLARSGMPRRAIAAHLVISPRTVDSHLQRIYRKLGVADRRGLAAVMPNDGATSGGEALAQ